MYINYIFVCMHKYKLYNYTKYNYINYNPISSFLFVVCISFQEWTLYIGQQIIGLISSRGYLSLSHPSVFSGLYFLVSGCDPVRYSFFSISVFINIGNFRSHFCSHFFERLFHSRVTELTKQHSHELTETEAVSTGFTGICTRYSTYIW